MQSNSPEQVPNENTELDVSASAARKRFEQERLTRRKALRKLGMVSGIAAVGLLSIDDLARLSASKLKEYKATAEIGDSLAREFHSAGVAFATGVSSASHPEPSPPVPPCNSVCDAQYDACISATHAEYEGIWCGPDYVFCPSIQPKLAECEEVKDNCDSFCEGKSTGPADPNAPFDPTKCQDEVDDEVLRNLVGPGYDGVDGVKDHFKAAVKECAKSYIDDPSGVADCVKGKAIEILPDGSVKAIKIKQYLECAYIACLAEIMPKDERNPCKW